MNIILKNTFDNLGGVFRFFFIPKNDVEEIGDEIEGIINSIFLKEEKSWFIFDIVQKGLQFLYEKQEGKKGQSFPVGLKGFIPKDTLEVRNILRSMDNHRFIIIYQDRNNNYVLAGSKEVPLRFRSAFTTDKQEGLNGHEIEFSAKTIDRPFYVDPQVLNNSEAGDPEEPLPEPGPDVIWSCDYSISEIVVKGDIVELQVTVNRLDEGTTISTNPVVVTWTIIDAGFPYEIDMIFGESGTESFSETQQANLAGDGETTLTFQLNSELLPMGNNTVNVASHCGSQDIQFEVIPKAEIEFAMDLSLRYDVMDLVADTCSINGDVAYIIDGSAGDNSTFNEVSGTFNNLQQVLGDIDYKIQLNNDTPIEKNSIVVGGSSTPFNQLFTEKFIRGVNTVKLIIDNEIIQTLQFTVNFPAQEPVFVYQDDYASARACNRLSISFSVLNDSEYNGQALIQVLDNGEIAHSESLAIEAGQTGNIGAALTNLGTGSHQLNILLNGIPVYSVTEEIPELFPVAEPAACSLVNLLEGSKKIKWPVANIGCVDGDIKYYTQLDSGALLPITKFVPVSASILYSKIYTGLANGSHTIKVYHADRSLHCSKSFSVLLEANIQISGLCSDPLQPIPTKASRAQFTIQNTGTADGAASGQLKMTRDKSAYDEGADEYFFNFSSPCEMGQQLTYFLFLFRGEKTIEPYDILNDNSLPLCTYGDYTLELLPPWGAVQKYQFSIPMIEYTYATISKYGAYGVRYRLSFTMNTWVYAPVVKRARLIFTIHGHSTIYTDFKYSHSYYYGASNYFESKYYDNYFIPDGQHLVSLACEVEGHGILIDLGTFTWNIQNGESAEANYELINNDKLLG